MSSKRRPYLSGKQSLIEFFDAPVRHLKDLVTKESAFEKPYWDEDYRKMHFDMPWPDWPSWDPPTWPDSPDTPGPIPGGRACAIVCYAPSNCEDPIWCHPGIWCGEDIQCQFCGWQIEGDGWGYTPNHDVGFPWGIDVWINGAAAQANPGGLAHVLVKMVDPCGNECQKAVSVFCTDCPPEIEVSWDTDNSATEIVRSTSVDIYVKNGLGNYEWSVSGTGFSVGHHFTTGVGNTLVANSLACGTAVVTVTDACGGVATGYVLCTTGHWEELCYSAYQPNCYRHSSGDASAQLTYHYVGEKRITIEQRCLYAWNQYCRFASCGGYNSADYIPDWPCWSAGVDCNDIIGANYTCAPNQTTECCMLNLGIKVEEWICP